MRESDPQNASPDFEWLIEDTLGSLPPELRDRISNVEIVVEDGIEIGKRTADQLLAHHFHRRGKP